MEGRSQERGLKVVGEAVLAVVASQILLNLELFSIFFIVPLLLFSIRNGEKKAIVLFLANALIIIGVDCFLMRFSLSDKFGVAFLLIDLFIPLSLLAAGIVWLRRRGDHRLLRRLLLTLLPSLILLVFYGLFIFSDRALPGELYAAYGNAFAVILEPVMTSLLPGIDIEIFISLIFTMVLCLLYPVLFIGVCASCFIYETALHSRESGWDETVMRFSFPPDAIWGFIISWALVLILRFVSAPLLLEIAVMNIAIVWALIYAIQGFTVVFARVRRRYKYIRSMTVLIILIAFSLLIPGINFIILFGVPILGVVENFFDLKKIGARNEDHS